MHLRHQQTIKFCNIKRACRSKKKKTNSAIEEYAKDMTKEIQMILKQMKSSALKIIRKMLIKTTQKCHLSYIKLTKL